VTRVAMKMIVALRGWSMWQAKLGQRILHIQQCLRTLFPTQLPHLRPTPRPPGRLLRLGLSRPNSYHRKRHGGERRRYSRVLRPA
jgi:hypothetical protein